jgi:hypothetical protein
MMRANKSGGGVIAMNLASVWKGVFVGVLSVDAHYWLGRVCHVGELDVVFAFVQVLHE